MTAEPKIDEFEMKVRERTTLDLIAYAAGCLMIRTKTGELQPFVMNSIQRQLHRTIEDQRRKTGKVRTLILKGRQLGCSTYVGARYYQAATNSSGLRVFILTHSDQATKNLFEMVERFHDRCPEPWRPQTGASNARELAFPKLDSGYMIGTAGTRDVGRSATIQRMHGSEVAFWPHADTHVAGILQAVPDEAGSEIILESTANGFGNLFHAMWEEAQSGRSDYRAIFLPWFQHEEYARPVPRDLYLSVDDLEVQRAYKLSDYQMAWRDAKIRELKSELLFRQEYPCTAAEAFQLTGHDAFIPPSLVVKARKTHYGVPVQGPLIAGFDPAWTGGDRHSLCLRRGRKVVNMTSRVGLSVTESAGWAAHVIQSERPVRMFVDVGGVGAGVYDILIEQGFGDVVRAVQFGGKPLYSLSDDHGGPANRRAEMWQAMKDWLEDPAGVSIPDSDALQADLAGPGYSWNSQSQLVLESKEHMRKRDVKSPDEADALALTFAEPVIPSRMREGVKRDMRWVV